MDACGQEAEEFKNSDFLVDVINGRPLTELHFPKLFLLLLYLIPKKSYFDSECCGTFGFSF